MKFELQPYNRDALNAELLADLRAVAAQLNASSLTQAKYDAHGRFCAATLKKRFKTWNKAIDAAGLVPTKLQSVDPALLIADIRRVAAELNAIKLTHQQYCKRGKYSRAVVSRLFGKWKSAVVAAQLQPGWNYEITEEQLLDNMERVWRHLGRQPTKDDMARPVSKYSSTPYTARFGGYRKALERFVAAINDGVGSVIIEGAIASGGPNGLIQTVAKQRTSRTVNWRLRFLTLRRDGFRCKACGRSPATTPGVQLVVDHILPWSNGGETELENLQSLCEPCNGGKSNLPFTAE